MGGTAFYLRRKKQGALAVPAGSRLTIVETVRVSPRAQVVLTQVNGRLLLLGVTDRSVHRIAWAGRASFEPKHVSARAIVNEDVDDAPTMRPAAPAARAPSGPSRPFQGMLDALKRVSTNAPPPSNAALQIAEETVDTYERRSPANSNRMSSVPPATTTALRSLEALVASVPQAPQLSQVSQVSQLEGQVSGLRRRAASKRKS